MYTAISYRCRVYVETGTCVHDEDQSVVLWRWSQSHCSWGRSSQPCPHVARVGLMGVINSSNSEPCVGQRMIGSRNVKAAAGLQTRRYLQQGARRVHDALVLPKHVVTSIRATKYLREKRCFEEEGSDSHPSGACDIYDRAHWCRVHLLYCLQTL